MLRRIGFAAASIAFAASVSVAAPRDAAACGGCFHPESSPTTSQSPSVVTDHRMVVALSSNMTTLWDQVEYAGDPAEFAWVLPVRGAVTVGIGNDAFIDALDQQTQLQINAPRRRCAYPNNGCGGSGTAGCGSSDSAEDITPGYQEDSGIFVTGRSTVGPYSTVQVHGTDEGAIVGWLRAHKFVVPTDIEPMLTKYVGEGFDFLAVRLRPNVGVHAMVPIRVSWKGSTPILPLRMVRAGAGTKVGLKLFVIGDGRWKAKNYATFSIDPNGLSWDFVNQRSDYTTIRDKMAASFDGRAFALESSLDLLKSAVPRIPATALPGDVDAGADVDTVEVDASPVDAADSSVSDTSVSDASASDTMLADGADDATGDETATDAGVDSALADTGLADTAVTDTSKPTYDAGTPPAVDPYASDVEIAFGSYIQRRVTRLRADMPVKYLDQDLELEADDNQDPLTRSIQVNRSSTAVVCPGLDQIARSGDDDSAPFRVGLTLGLAALGAILARRASRH